MNILFYMEPLIEMGNPYFKKGWMNRCISIIETLKQSKNGSNYKFSWILNEPLNDQLKVDKNVQTIVLTQSELLKPFKGGNYLDATLAWYKKTYTEEQLEYYIYLIEEKLIEKPDIIITFSPVPFLEKAYEDALILHYEYSIFSRAPYPESWYLDIVGMNGSAYLSKYWKELDGNFKWTDEQKTLLKDFKNKIKALLKEKNPYKEWIKKYKKEFDKLILLPLQFSQYYLFDGETDYKNQYDYMIDVLEKVPKNIGVIVTTHPEYNILTSEVIDFCRRKYKNFIYSISFEEYYAASQYMMAFVDGVVTVSSSVGYQTLIWDNQLITLGNSYLNFIADSNTLEDIKWTLEKFHPSKDKILFWMLTHFVFTREYIYNPRWLDEFLVKSIRKYRTKESLLNFYEWIDEDLYKLFTVLKNSLYTNIPRRQSLNNYSKARLKDLCIEQQRKLKPIKHAQLFLDMGKGFCEEHSIKYPIHSSTIVFEYDLRNYKNIVNLRFDPADVPIIVEIKKIEVITCESIEGIKRITTNAEYTKKNTCYFLTEDGQIYFEPLRGYDKIEKLRIHVNYKNLDKDSKKIIIDSYHHDLEKDYMMDLFYKSCSQSPEFVEDEKDFYVDLKEEDVKLIAFYLPQFHPIPENDEWWGKGFTEWTNVTKAVPQFINHHQPQLPIDVGFYDLRNIEAQKRQIALAKKYGIYGFCFYHYWFGGKRLLETPMENFLANPKELDFPFCLCWANENWTRRWDGLDNEILISQKNSPEDDLKLIEDLRKYIEDKRYIRVNGKPLVMIYRPRILPQPSETVKRWRDYCREKGMGEIYLVGVKNFELEDPTIYGFDAAVEFPPNNYNTWKYLMTEKVKIINPNFKGHIWDYVAYVREKIYLAKDSCTTFKTVCPGWDNTPRRPNGGHLFYGSNPKVYKEWLENVMRFTKENMGKNMQYVFINAWNEWAEGAHLEPDRRYGYGNLRSCAEAIIESRKNKN
ncbi:MAG: glycoside hydrolase family 99-like domain-containing protein [Marinisporobacter sp.]|nr:glycoside hydrolase family 99-like domain-containing protein [Marinisporobacter sp.]